MEEKKQKVIELSVGVAENELKFGEELGLLWKDGVDVSFKLTADKFLDHFVERCGENLVQKLQSMQNDESETFEQTLNMVPVYPCPVLKSKLVMALEYMMGEKKIKESPPLESSFRIFKKLLRAEKVIFLHSKNLKLEEKKKIQNMKMSVLNSITAKLFLVYTKLAMLPLNENSSITNYLMENFYNNLNLIRIWEFTILDYLGVPKKFQGNYITSEVSIIPNDISIFRGCATSILEDTKTLFEKLINTNNVEKKITWETLCPKDIDPPEWIFKKSSLFVLFHLKYSKELKKEDKWFCGNSKCKKQENVKREFKQCSKCQWTRYCSRECQVTDWNEKHKKDCCKEKDKDYFAKGRLLIGPDV